MSSNEGIRRIYLLAKLIAIFGSLLGVVLWFSVAIISRHGAIGELVAWVAIPVTIGAFLAVIAWIVEGFIVGPRHARDQSSI